MKGLLFVALVACGGATKAPRSPEGRAGTDDPGSECRKLAAHVADAVFTWSEPPPTSKDNVVQVIAEHCQADQWSAEAKQCFGAITTEDSAKPCAERLTKDQHDKVMSAMMEKLDRRGHEPPPAQAVEEGKMGRGSPKPMSAPPPPAKGPAKGADPCEGGE